jgi:hypothetical protein
LLHIRAEDLVSGGINQTEKFPESWDSVVRLGVLYSARVENYPPYLAAKEALATLLLGAKGQAMGQ